MRVLAASTALAVMLASCTLITSLDGLSGDPSDTPAADAGPDATTSDEAGRDATSEAGDAGTFCEGRDATFCDDFERSTLIGLWENVDTSTGGEIRLEDGHVVVTMTAGLPSGSNATLGKTFPSVSHVIYGYELTVRQLPDSGSHQINNLYVHQGANTAFVSLLADVDGIKAAEQVFPNGAAGAFKGRGLVRMPVIGKKVSVVFDLDMPAGGTPVYTITFDGDPVYSGALDPSFFKTGSIDVKAGTDYVQAPTSGLVYEVDDVFVKTYP